MSLRIGPVTKTQARAFVTEHHRHNEAPTQMQVTIQCGLFDDDELVGVATAGQPVNQNVADGVTLEINRTCIDGYHRNGNSMLYGAICRAAKALGYQRVVTYTLHSESGASLKASGFTCAADIGARSWTETNVRVRYDYNLFGERRQAANEPKYRWERTL